MLISDSFFENLFQFARKNHEGLNIADDLQGPIPWQSLGEYIAINRNTCCVHIVFYIFKF
jgi:hypothetical protein